MSRFKVLIMWTVGEDYQIQRRQEPVKRRTWSELSVGAGFD